MGYLRTTFALTAAFIAVPGLSRAEPPVLQATVSEADDFKLSGSIRLRFEALDGQPRAGLRASDEQLALRSILGAEYAAGPIRLFAEMHDSRTWLYQPGSALSANEVDTFELVQANVGLTLQEPIGLGTRLALQVGRMTLGLGSRRLVASDDYRNVTNGYTGLRADLHLANGTLATAIYVLPHIRLPDDLPSLRAQKSQWDRESFDLQLWGGLLARPNTFANTSLEIGYFSLRERDWVGHPTRNRNLDNFSLRLLREPKAGLFDGEIEGIYQTGNVRTSIAPDAIRQPVSAWFVHADIGYTFSIKSKLRLSVEYDRASGDGESGKYGRFDTLFGMRGADFAQSGIYNAVGRANISSLGFRAEFPLVDRFEGYTTYRPMWLAEKTDAFSTTNVRDQSGASGSFAGHQIELQLRYWLIKKFLRAQLNVAWLGKGAFLKNAPNASTKDNTRYLATTLSAHF